MMYLLVKAWVRLGLRFYCSRIVFDEDHVYEGNAPLLIASSHPNSFFDALVIGAHHPRKLHFLARGDAFKNPTAAKILRALNMIPIYRLSEGKENLANNDDTFSRCIEILKNNGCVLIFSEGISENDWGLRPLKKGTGRLAWMAWQEHQIDDMLIQPTGVSYRSFDKLPKQVEVHFAPCIEKTKYTLDSPAKFYQELNTDLTEEISQQLLPRDAVQWTEKRPAYFKVLLALPALLGFILHYPLYGVLKKFVRKKTKGTVFYDSVLFAGMLLFYPIYLILLVLIIYSLTLQSTAWLLLLAIPYTGWAYKEFKA